MKLVATILEESSDRVFSAIAAMRGVPDMIEVRAEHLGEISFEALRRATSLPIILTHRGMAVDGGRLRLALAEGIDFVDVEFRSDLRLPVAPDRIVLSHHDFDGMPDIDRLLSDMRAHRCAFTKIAVTPSTLDENLRLLRHAADGTTVIGMGEQGLFSRIAAPFYGSGLAFASAGTAAAPGQLTLERAIEIYGEDRSSSRSSHLFAVAGNPAGHSRSPAIHNRLFRARGANAAYTIASFPTFAPIGAALLRGDLTGLSVTAPFKADALQFAIENGATIAPNAREAEAVNTLASTKRGLIADNTDVDGFTSLLRSAGLPDGAPRQAAIIGAGATARAAWVALHAIGIEPRIFNRSHRQFPGSVEPLEVFDDRVWDVLINTLPPDAGVAPRKRADISIEAAYPTEVAVDARISFSGLDLLEAQAIRQNERFLEAFD